MFLAELFYFLETLFRCVVYRCDGATRSRLPFLPFYQFTILPCSVDCGTRGAIIQSMRHMVSVAFEIFIDTF